MVTMEALIFLSTLVFGFLCHLSIVALAKSHYQACSTVDPCQAFVLYKLRDDLTLLDVAGMFGTGTDVLLEVNDLGFAGNGSISAGTLVKVPQSCACIGGSRRGNSTVYVVKAGDTLFEIARSFGNFVTYQQIAIANGIPNPDLIFPRQQFVIPFPCACDEGIGQARPAVFLSYRVQSEDDLAVVAKNYNTTVDDLMRVNCIPNSALTARDIIYIPLADIFTPSRLVKVRAATFSESLRV
eukprot:c15265_g1_i1 orf=251-970(+)